MIEEQEEKKELAKVCKDCYYYDYSNEQEGYCTVLYKRVPWESKCAALTHRSFFVSG